MFKRLNNIESKIKSKDKPKLEPIKNKEQSVLKDESTVADKKPKEIVLLKDKLDYIFKDFSANFDSAGKNFVKSLLRMKKRLIIIICFLK